MCYKTRAIIVIYDIIIVITKKMLFDLCIFKLFAKCTICIVPNPAHRILSVILVYP